MCQNIQNSGPPLCKRYVVKHSDTNLSFFVSLKEEGLFWGWFLTEWQSHCLCQERGRLPSQCVGTNSPHQTRTLPAAPEGLNIFNSFFGNVSLRVLGRQNTELWAGCLKQADCGTSDRAVLYKQPHTAESGSAGRSDGETLPGETIGALTVWQ